VAARLLLAGWAIRYEASACVYHSHDYPVVDEFRRYFDIGVFYGREKWITEHFGQGTREGIRFIRSEVRYLAERGHWGLMPAMAARAVTKYLGYRLGHAERLLPHAAKRRLSACPSFWSAQAG
jgi:rhamnosyltransferase